MFKLFAQSVRLLASLLILSGTALWADETPAEKPAAGVEELIQQLDSNRFAERQNATQRLAEMGKDVFPALTKAAQGDARETTLRAVDVLRQHLDNSDEATKTAAKESLEKLVASDHPLAANRAKEVFRVREQEEAKKQALQNQNRFGGRIVPAQIQIQMQAVAGNNVRKKVQIANGVKDIEIEENGRKIKIKDDPNNGIKIEVTEKQGDKEVTTKYEAKNADDLKKNSPEGFKLYEKHAAGQQGGILVPGIQLQVNPLQLPPGVPQVVPAPRQLFNKAADDLEKAQREIFQAGHELTKLRVKPDANKTDLDDTLKRLEQVKKLLEEAKAKLDG